ncbi:MAG: hypothetical protein IPL32_04260 [Chloracidobacterium sp.]|nr:hypothetical protein [Chloracidobacterium sp.]
MNDDDLKAIWQNDKLSTTISSAELKTLADQLQIKLRRNARIDFWVQAITTAACFIPVFFYPRLIFAAMLALILGIWYVRKIRGLYKDGHFLEPDRATVSESINAEVKNLKSFFWQTRIAVYIFVPLMLTATYYGIGSFDNPTVSIERRAVSLAKLILIAEISSVICCEIYFWMAYKPAVKKLTEVLRQLNSIDS